VKKILPLLGLLFFPGLAFSQPNPGLVSFAKECRCDSRVQDPFEIPVRYNYGTYQGQCLDTCHFRDGRMLVESLEGMRKQIIVANYLHQNRFWRASVPVENVTEAYVIFEDFLRGVAHVALRFRFNAPVRLTSQGNLSLQRQASTYDLVFSAEGTPPAGRGLDLFQATMGNYLITYRLLSTRDMMDSGVRKKKHTVWQYRLKLSSEERARLLELALKAASERRLGSSYALFSNNCATTAVDLVAQSTGRYAPFWEWFTRAISYSADVGTYHWLASAGLVERAEGGKQLKLGERL
jgi:Domain of unknown function (DUF4105)